MIPWISENGRGIHFALGALSPSWGWRQLEDMTSHHAANDGIMT
jgi:hypothetical protein